MNVTADHDVIALWARPDEVASLSASTTQEGWATFPESRAARPVQATVTVHGDRRSVTPLKDLLVAHPHIASLPDGQTLVVGSRAYWSREHGAEQNALVYDEQGNVVAQGTLGDGIEHIQTSVDGDVWVGYFDEGIYGNYGWGAPDGPEPLGSAGLVRFDGELRKVWEFPSGTTAPAVSDCYALNVGASSTWACYYTDFPVVRIEQDRISVLSNDVHGARALTAAGRQISFFGGYGDDRNRLVLAELDEDRVIATQTSQLVLPDGGSLDGGPVAHGRGERLHVLIGRRWLQVDPAGDG